MYLLYQNIFVVWTENKIYSKQDTSHLLPCLENQFHCQICTCKSVNCVFYKQIDLKPTKKSYERFLENDFMSPQAKVEFTPGLCCRKLHRKLHLNQHERPRLAWYQAFSAPFSVCKSAPKNVVFMNLLSYLNCQNKLLAKMFFSTDQAAYILIVLPGKSYTRGRIR